jgi:hypothetical protein
MARNFLTPINLNSLELQNFIVHNVANDPTGVTGRLYYNSTSNTLKVYNGSSWLTVATGGSTFTLGSTSVSIGGTTTTVSGLTLGASSVWNGDTIGVAYGGTGTVNGSITGTGALTFTAGGSNTNVVLVPNGTGAVNVSSKTIINLADPVNDTDAANKRYVDNVSLGVNSHASAVALIDSTIAGTYTAGTTGADGGTGVGAYITYTNTGVVTVDTTVTLAQYDRVVVNGGVTADTGTASIANGIYVVTTAGAIGVAAVLTRAADFDNSNFGDVTSGDLVYIAGGSNWGGTQWVQTIKGTATIGTGASTRYSVKIGTDDITFTQFSGVSSVTAGAGLVKNGNAFDVVGTTDRITVNNDSIDISSNYVGQSTITTLGTVTTGTWSATTIATNKGGTGLTSFTSGGAVYATSTSALTTGTLPVASGGTGATSFTSGSLLKGAGTSAVAVASASDIVTAIGSTAVTNATNATTATNATNVAVTNDAATATSVYPAWVGANTGNNGVKTTSAALSFVPSTGTLSATVFSGSGASLTSLSASNLSSGTVPGDRGVTAGSATASFVEYNGTTATTGQFDGGTTAPSGTTRLNYGGYLYATRFYGDGSNVTALSGSNISSGTVGFTYLPSIYIGTTAVQSSSATQALTGISTITGGTTLGLLAPSNSSNGYAVSLTGGASSGTSGQNGGAVTITGGASSSGTNLNSGGNITITGGASNTTQGTGGSVTINGGLGSSANGNGVVQIGTSNTDTVTIGASGKTVQLPGVGTSGFVKLGVGGALSADTNTYLTSSTGVTTVNGSSGAIGATANSNGALTRYYRATNSAGTTTTINHAYGQWVLVQVYKTSDGTLVEADVANTATNSGTTTVTFAASQTAGDYTIVIIG